MLDKDQLAFITRIIGEPPEWNPELEAQEQQKEIDRWKVWSAQRALVGRLRVELGIDQGTEDSGRLLRRRRPAEE